MSRLASVGLAFGLAFSGALTSAEDLEDQLRDPVEATLERPLTNGVSQPSHETAVKNPQIRRLIGWDGPLTSAIRKEPVPLALAPQGGSSDVEWSHVRKLKPGREIMVTIRGSQAATRVFVSADDSRITVLNLTDPMLRGTAARALREIASQHLEYLEGATKGETFLFGGVQLRSAGVFVDNQKIADLHHVIERHARPDVAQIMVRRGRGVWGHLGPLGGFFLGGTAAGLVTGQVCQATVGYARCDAGGAVAVGYVGAIAGGVYGFHAARRETDDVIYRAP